MDRLFLLLVVFAQLATTSNVFAVDETNSEMDTAVTPAEIMTVIQESADQNPEVEDPDLIKPGQELKYEFEDGFIYTHTVEKGESQWDIVENELKTLSSFHGPLLGYDPVPLPQSGSKGEKTDSQESGFPPLWGWIAFGIVLLILVGLAGLLWWTNKKHREAHLAREYPAVDPCRQGEPIESGGLSPDFAYQHFANRLSREGYQDFQILSLEKGRLSGRGRVSYRDREAQKLTLDREPGYRARIRHSDGNEETLYTLERCCNPARLAGRYEGFQFEPENSQPEQFQAVNKPAEETVSTGESQSGKQESGFAGFTVENTLTENGRELGTVTTKVNVQGSELTPELAKVLMEANESKIKSLTQGDSPASETEQKEQ